jgi:MFS family permease
MGTGITNWLFAIPAIYTIDTFGRRNLLLTTFPLMGICLLWCGLSFYLPNNPDGTPTQGRLASIAAAIYTCKSLDHIYHAVFFSLKSDIFPGRRY